MCHQCTTEFQSLNRRLKTEYIKKVHKAQHEEDDALNRAKNQFSSLRISNNSNKPDRAQAIFCL